MLRLVTKSGCDRCCRLVAKLSEPAKSKVILLRGSNCCSFIGIGDVVEWLIHLAGLHKVWARLHGQNADWVCPGCKRRKNRLNKLWYFGDKEHKKLWAALVDSPDLAADAEYPFIVSVSNREDEDKYFFLPVSNEGIENPSCIDEALKDQCDE